MARKEQSGPAVAPQPGRFTNIWKFPATRRRPEAGDVFAVSMLGSRWVIGRVVCTDSEIGSFGPIGHLVYFYDLKVATPAEVRLPIAPRLLVAPMVLDYVEWTHGYFLHVQESELLPEEKLPRHVFDRGPEVDRARAYIDEYQRPTGPPLPDDMVKYSGISGLGVVDSMLSEALGIPEFVPPPPPPTTLAALESHLAGAPRVGLKRKSHRVKVCLPLANSSGTELDPDHAERVIEASVKKAKAGRWSGHGTNLRTSMFDIEFTGRDVSTLIKAIREGSASMAEELPPGVYVDIELNTGEEFRMVM